MGAALLAGSGPSARLRELFQPGNAGRATSRPTPTSDVDVGDDAVTRHLHKVPR